MTRSASVLVPFPGRDVEPGGWIRDQLRADLCDGFVGHLDQLAPDLLVADDIFGRDRLTADVRSKDVGSIAGAPGPETAWTEQFLWWNGETQGNWADGWLRHVMWAGDEGHREAARDWVERILGTQDQDGYLGICAPDLRFPEQGENGELWTQACLLRALLGYASHTGDTRVLEAVRRAVERTMAGYPMPGPATEGSHPFGVAASFGGVSHGLMFTDVLWELANLTGDAACLAYAAWLYRAFSASAASERDIAADRLLAEDGFRGHGPHTYEHWRALTIAAAADVHGGQPPLPFARLQDAYLRKLDRALTPSGAPNGDEWCHAEGSADLTGYEFCSVQELLHSYGNLVEVTGDPAWGDRMESLVFNVGMGARDPVDGGVAYLKTDNSRSMTGVEGFRPAEPGENQTRYRYSPVHREAAVCCVPNAGRLLPTYLRYSWLRGTRDGVPQLAVLLYGESRLSTTIAGVPVTITQATAYPADHRVRFTVETGVPLVFVLSLRQPGWARRADVTGVGAERVSGEGGFLHVQATWPAGSTSFDLELGAEPEIRDAEPGTGIVAQGPLLFAQPLPGRREIVRTYPVQGTAGPFRDVAVHATVNPTPVRLRTDVRPRTAPVAPGSEAAGAAHAWQRLGMMVVGRGPDGAPVEVSLVPMGATVLRQLTFELEP